MGRLQADTSWTTCRSLEKKLSVWRLCWISGGYRLEAASRPIALYIVGIRGAQGRSQHDKSGTGTLVESESWLAMADCLGRFGRASHSNPRYHSPTQNFGQVQMHVQRNSCDPCDQIRLVLRLHAICHLARQTAILQSSCRAYAPFTVSSLVEYYKTCCHPTTRVCMPFARQGDAPSGAAHQTRYARDPWCWVALQSLALEAWHRPHLAMSATRLAYPIPPPVLRHRHKPIMTLPGSLQGPCHGSLLPKSSGFAFFSPRPLQARIT